MPPHGDAEMVYNEVPVFGVESEQLNDEMLFSAASLLQEGLSRKRLHLVARLQGRNVEFTAMTGSFRENRAEMQMFRKITCALKITFLLVSSFNINI